jgi:RHS repeat-associated protein
LRLIEVTFGTEWVHDFECVDNYWTRRPGGGKYFYIPYPTWDAAQENDPDITRWFYRYWDSTWMSQYFVGQPRAPDYDAAGNMTYEGTQFQSIPNSNLALNYDYDAENRLIRVYNAYWRVNFAYDYMSRMVRQYTEINEDDYWSLEIDWRFVYDGNRMIARYLADGGISPYESLVWGLDISQSAEGAGGIGGLAVLFRHGANKRYVPGYDERGNVILLYGVDESTYGYVVSEYEYSDHGELLRATGWTGPSTRVGYDPVYNSFRWQTKWWLHAAAGTDNGKVFNLYNFGYRWYHPGHGRFINRDPIGEEGGINLYAYVGNDPVNRWDWMGWWCFDIYEIVEVTGGSNGRVESRGNQYDYLKTVCIDELSEISEETGEIIPFNVTNGGNSGGGGGGGGRGSAENSTPKPAQGDLSHLPGCSELKALLESGIWQPTLTSESFIPDARVGVVPLGLTGFEQFHGDGRDFLAAPSDGSPGQTSRMSVSVGYDAGSFAVSPSFRIDPSIRTRWWGMTSTTATGAPSSMSGYSMYTGSSVTLGIAYSGSNPLAPYVVNPGTGNPNNIRMQAAVSLDFTTGLLTGTYNRSLFPAAQLFFDGRPIANLPASSMGPAALMAINEQGQINSVQVCDPSK